MEVGFGVVLWGEVGENLGGVFIVYEVVCVIDWVEDIFLVGVGDWCFDGEGEVVVVFDIFYDDFDWLGVGLVVFKLGDDGVFVEFIDVVDCIGGGDVGDVGEF